MSIFAKIFFNKNLEQILVLKEQGDEGEPQISVMVEPPNLGICKISNGFPDTGDGWSLRDKQFSEFDLVRAEKMASSIYDMLAPIITEETDG